MKSECLHNSNRDSMIKSLLHKKRRQTFTSCITNSETKEEFLYRQTIYEKLYKSYQYNESIPKDFKKQNPSSDGNGIKCQILQKRESYANYFIFKDDQLEQQQRSIETIAEFLRNQKKLTMDKQVPIECKQKQYNLLMILVIVLPILCILTVLAEL
ncbi:unnamed protein product (macronuclear) [Paramecium tetraurelia]|uniref:Transmembrane protein n=1 Tax=Paramecium tetraurelia TaxID=5888 RepID=A0BMK1_PARTE|nr:uncharacterized protein GSPATT00030404001 [Paramecium tetraurelia]CAK59768.1 unnamed protein product [Paramecium tetraurelia]|eukprot:XP_001427166.1 hypothetical protein (macronuclear) [Paramecium tetraurelia strain d4-2]